MYLLIPPPSLWWLSSPSPSNFTCHCVLQQVLWSWYTQKVCKPMRCVCVIMAGLLMSAVNLFFAKNCYLPPFLSFSRPFPPPPLPHTPCLFSHSYSFVVKFALSCDDLTVAYIEGIGALVIPLLTPPSLTGLRRYCEWDSMQWRSGTKVGAVCPGDYCQHLLGLLSC